MKMSCVGVVKEWTPLSGVLVLNYRLENFIMTYVDYHSVGHLKGFLFLISLSIHTHTHTHTYVYIYIYIYIYNIAKYL